MSRSLHEKARGERMTQRTKYVVSVVLSLAFALCLAAPVSAQEAVLITPPAPQATAARLVNVGLGFLFIISVVSILMGGFKYLISGGSTDKAEEARKYIISGIIGLAIVLSMWAVTMYMVTDVLAPVAPVL